MRKINKPTCPKHPFMHLSGLGCLACNGEKLAKVDHNRKGEKRVPKFTFDRGVMNLPDSAAPIEEDLDDLP